MSIFFNIFAAELQPKCEFIKMGTIILYSILLVLVIFAGLWFIQHSQFRNEERKRQFELKRESQKSVSPIRLRAYERLTLLLERTKPEHMIIELQQKEPEALTTWSVPQLQQYLLQTIRAEFDHNQSQQVYVSAEVWDAIISAREKIVDGAVSMVKMALDKLADENIVELDEEKKAAMVSNLLVVLCGDEPAQPVINSGTLNH